MTTAQLSLRLTDALADRQLLTAPFYRRWEAGLLGREDLRSYAAQYRHFEREQPEILHTVADQLGDGFSRDMVLRTLDDEVGPPAHLELFDKFANALDAPTDAAPSPAMARLIDVYRELCSAGPAQGLGALAAYETQAAAVASSKAEGLLNNYGLSEGDVEFWSTHAQQDKEHGEWTTEALAALDDADTAVAAARRAADAWWAFLDERESIAVTGH